MSSNDILSRQIADVAELADAHDSGSCEITLIGVQVPSSALTCRSQILTKKGLWLFLLYSVWGIQLPLKGRRRELQR